MANRKRKCIVCGKEYEYCPSCRSHSSHPAWMTRYDSENCREIYTVCADYAANFMDRIEAKARLKKCDLSDKENFTESTKRIIDEILATPKKTAAKNVKETKE